MAVWWLILFPLVMAAMTFVLPSDRWRPWLLPLSSVGHLFLVCRALASPPAAVLNNWLVLDPLGKLFLLFVSVLFLLCSTYTAGYLRRDRERPNRVFCTCLLLSLSMMTLVILSHHLGLMWVAMEATTLAMAPNIYHYRSARSLEATWKYLVICSVGIALALMGSFFLAYATLQTDTGATLLLDDLLRQAHQLSHPWLQASFVLILIGYGTKMGLAPMHTWLPDAHGEAPAPVSAMLSGALLPCAFLAILRVFHVCNAAGEASYAQPKLIFIGLFSMAIALVFMVRQRDLKRLLAYSSIEHMGILVLAIGIGGVAVFGAFLHVVNNGLIKVALFLCAGNIQSAYGSKMADDVGGLIRRLPLTGALFLASFFAITGSPPFGPFVSEFTIVTASIHVGHFLVGILFLVLLALVFIAMGSTVLALVAPLPSPVPKNTLPEVESGDEGAAHHDSRETFLTIAPVLTAVGIVLMLGSYIPEPLARLLREAAAYMEVHV